MATQTEYENAQDLPSLPAFVYGKLKHDILSGAFPAGAVLRQETIAGSLGVSRLPVREALARLEAEQLVESRPRRGYVVTLLDVSEIAEIFELRAMLEERAGSLAAQRRTKDDIREVGAALEAITVRKIGSPEDAALFSLQNRNFHDRLFASGKSAHTLRLLLTLRDNVERYVRAGAMLLGTLSPSGHQEIFNAFRRGDAERTGKLCHRHVRLIGERLIAMLNEQRNA